MVAYHIHDKASAPKASKPLLEQSASVFGQVPNLMGVMAESPAVLQGYMDLSATLVKSSFSPDERHAVMLAASVENQCHYCVAAHTGLARGAGLSADSIIGIREDDDMEDERIEVLVRFTRSMVARRGKVEEGEIDEFLQAGFTRANLLEVVAHIALKTMSNYVNQLAETPLDSSFAMNKWSPVD